MLERRCKPDIPILANTERLRSFELQGRDQGPWIQVQCCYFQGVLGLGVRFPCIGRMRMSGLAEALTVTDLFSERQPLRKTAEADPVGNGYYAKPLLENGNHGPH